MVELERLWRITTSVGQIIQIRLSADGQDGQQVVLEPHSSGQADGQSFDIDVARAIAQAMLEACEVALALE